MPAIDYYYLGMSPPCRVVLLVAKALGVQMNLKKVDLMQGEHLKPEFIKINPQHCLPTLDDDGLVLWESRAIISYLVEQYGKTDSLYPKDPKKRALVDQRLYFDIGTLNLSAYNYFLPVMFGGQQPDPKLRVKVDEALTLLNTLLAGQRYVAGNQKTIADYAIAVTISHIECLGFSFAKYSNVSSWFNRAKEEIVGYQELNQEPANMLAGIFKSKIAKK